MALLHILTVTLLATFAPACAGDVPIPPETGSLTLALRDTTPEGDLYQLQNAVVSITGPQALEREASPDEEILRAALPPGDYELALLPGWQLERVREGVAEPVDATLLDDTPQPFSIAVGEVTTLGLRFAVADASSIALGDGSLEVSIAVDVAPAVEPTPDGGLPCSETLVLNEIDYDQEGADEREFIEIHNPGPCRVATSGLSLVLYNGGASDDAPVSYATVRLESAGDAIAAGGYLVIGDAPVLAELPTDVLRIDLGTTALQNGDPDGASLELDGQILDSMSYGGDLAGVTEGQSGPTDREAGSLGRCAADTDDNATDFHALEAASPGEPNGCAL